MRPLAVLALFVTLAVAACGGDDATPFPTASAEPSVTVSPAP